MEFADLAVGDRGAVATNDPGLDPGQQRADRLIGAGRIEADAGNSW